MLENIAIQLYTSEDELILCENKKGKGDGGDCSCVTRVIELNSLLLNSVIKSSELR